MDPTYLASTIVILLFSVIVHEVMHGVAARYFGDHTAENAGRLTLNPIPHIDPIGTILMPLSLLVIPIFLGSTPGTVFGWAKPVPVNPLNFKNINQGELWTSAAGILVNLGIAIFAAILFHLSLHSVSNLISSILYAAVSINLSLAIFNLIPLPPLDGSKILMTILPTDLALKYRQLERYGFIILFILIFMPFGGVSPLLLVVGFLKNILLSLLGLSF